MSSDSNIWAFALHRYQQPGVAELLLRWQEEYQASINMVLWLLWLEYHGRVASLDHVQQARKLIEPWHTQVTRVLRQLRRQLKSQGLMSDEEADCYAQLKATELAAEKVELIRLAGLMVESTGVVMLPGQNLYRYLQVLAIPDTEGQLLLALLELSDPE